MQAQGLAGIGQQFPGAGLLQPRLDNDIYRAEAHLAQLNEMKELREAARPLMEYIQRKYNPHFKMLVDSHSVEVFDAQRRVML